MGGGGWGWIFFRIKGEWGLVKKEGMFSLPYFGTEGACHDIIKSADSQTNIKFSENDCIIAEILQKHLSNKWHQRILENKKVFEKPKLGGDRDASSQWRFFHLLANILSRMVGVYYSWEYIANMSDSIKRGIISVAQVRMEIILKK